MEALERNAEVAVQFPRPWRGARSGDGRESASVPDDRVGERIRAAPA